MTTGHGEKLSRRQEQAIACLLSKPTVEAAAQEAGLSPTTLKHWLTLPGFRKAYRQARVAVLEGTIGRLVDASTKAVTVLLEALEATKMGDRIRAAQIILTFAYRGVDVGDLQAELEAMRIELEGIHGTSRHNGFHPIPDCRGQGRDPGEGGAAQRDLG